MCKGWKANWEKSVSEALWKEEEWEEALEKIKEGVEEWWEMEKKREEEKIKRSTFNRAYKEIMPETEEKREKKEKKIGAAGYVEEKMRRWFTCLCSNAAQTQQPKPYS
ncbi:hypothetical protein PV326_001558 [Microctonus aethiopoides]|nr:hypothetical protein PV326_001558 [Microctonus aethiopoides]